MRGVSKIIFSAVFITACCSSYAQVNPAVAQEKLPGVWSFTLDGGYNIGISPTMRGTADQFVSDVVASYNNSKYPFGDPSTTASDIGGMFSYRFPSSNFGVFFGAQYNQFFVNTDQTIYSAFFSGNTKAYLAILTGDIGGEYTLGRHTDLFNAFARVGVNGNVIHGSVDLGTEMNTIVYSEFRLGAEGEIGGRLNFAGTPLAAEIGLDYTNANLIGKSYSAPGAQPPYPLHSRTLNDGANPNDPSDQSRTIDFLSLRVGAVVRM